MENAAQNIQDFRNKYYLLEQNNELMAKLKWFEGRFS